MKTKSQTVRTLIVTLFIWLLFCMAFTAKTQAVEPVNGAADAIGSAAAGFTDNPQPIEFAYVPTVCPFTYATTTGTIGTKLTINGEDFGNKPGKILIGDKKCKAYFWSDTMIMAQIVDVITPPGKYDIKVVPKDKNNEPLVCPEGFEIMAPEIGNIQPTNWACDNFYMTGKFFGSTKGKLRVYFEDENGKLIKAKVFGWQMQYVSGDSYCFFNIDLEPGHYKVMIENKVGASEPMEIMLTDNCEILPPG